MRSPRSLFAGSCARKYRYRMLRQYGVEQAGKARVDIDPAQRVHVDGAAIFRENEARFAQDLEVVRDSGLGPAAVELTTSGCFHASQAPHDVEADRIAQGIQHSF